MSPRPPLRSAALLRAAGFTFLELMAVIALVGILAAIVVANLDGLTDRSSLNASARALGNTILAIKDTATLQGREIWMEIDVGNQRWRIVDPPSATDVPDPDDRAEATWYGPWQTPSEGVVLDNVQFSRNDVEKRAVLEIGFDADGQLVPAGFIAYLRHENLPEEDGVSVEVTGLTGLVDYSRGPRQSEEVCEADEM